MDFASELRWVSSNPATSLAAGLIIIFIVGTLLAPSSRYNKNKIIRMNKTRLQTWLQWESPPYLSLGKYVQDGYSQVNKAKGKPFVIPVCGLETTILPAKYLPLLKQEDRAELSLCRGFEDMFNMTITSGEDGRHDHVEIDVVAKYINPRLRWKAFSTYELCSGLVYRHTARVLVGKELAQNTAYIDSILKYTESFLMSGFMWPVRPPADWTLIRKWWYYIGTWGLRRDINRSFKFLLPLINSRMEELEELGGQPQEKHMDLVQGLVEMHIPDASEARPIRHAHRILHLTFAASAVSSALLLHTIHQTLRTPEFLPELRAEIKMALEQNGGWTEKALLNMYFLESYIREMLRLCPPSVFTGQRTILSRSYTFDDDLKLPAQTRIAFPVLQIHTDADNYEDPLKFNPYRFMGSALGAGDNKAAFRINNKYLSFGYGKQACPGRFLAIRQVKLLLAKLFLEYEFQWAGGPDKGPERLNGNIVEGQIFPDLTTRVELRRREKI
ncbi:hypothetical protein G7Y89_g1492 [Cudoniella acicularis]|uniref:Cytochrome P450 n=1 Tax=Cudoniella acicularis TaxID=354080 RepID=A0A8H4RV68_9HELO|nr:hypothetical protein G7Y89_g1492 [Cudoniella acicularis]